MKFFLLSFLTLLTLTLAHAQGSRVLVQNAKTASQSNPMVNVKWYNQQFIYKKGVNVYRREAGENNWTKLNKVPVVMQQSVPPALLQRDEDLQAFLDMAKEMKAAEEDGFVLLTLFGKSFQSQDYSKLIGIQYDDASVEWGKSYEYRVTKIEAKKETELGISPSIRIENYLPSGVVKDFKVVLDKDIAKMTWKEDQDRFYGVNVYRNTKNDTSWIKLNKTAVVQSEAEGGPEVDVMFQEDSLKENMTYNYRIAGLDFFGEGSILSETVKIEVGDFTSPPPPLNLEKKVKVLDVTLSWEIQPVVDLAGFHVYRSTKSEGPFIKITSTILSKTDTSFTDHVPQPAFYYYFVASVDESGNESKSLIIMSEVQDVVPPLPPTHVAAKADTGKVVITWKRNAELDLKGYYIFRAISTDKQNKFVLINAEPLRDTAYTQVFAKNASNKFLFKVVAVDTSYNRSEPSEIVSARLPDVTAPIKPVIKNITVKGDSVIVSWLPNPEVDLKRFNLYRFKEGNPDGSKTVNKDSVINARARIYTDTVMQAGRYYYQLQAIDEAGNTSELSESFPIEKINIFRFAFGEIKVKYQKRKKRVLLTWTGSTKPSGYSIFRKSADDLTWKPVSGMITSGSFEDKSVTRKTEYSYQIRAYSRVGEVVVSPAVNIKTKK